MFKIQWSSFYLYRMNLKSESPLKAASLQEIKSELSALAVADLRKICLRLAKHKKENKELMSFLIFEAQDPETFTNKEINTSNLYLAKKGLRKILRIANKNIRFADTYEAEAELLIHFCEQMKKSGIRYQGSQVLTNLYNQQIKKIAAAISRMHEDLQFDYQKAFERIVEIRE